MWRSRKRKAVELLLSRAKVLHSPNRANADNTSGGLHEEVGPTAVTLKDVPAVLRRWWGRDPAYDSRARALASPKRAARLLGEYVGRRTQVGARVGSENGG